MFRKKQVRRRVDGAIQPGSPAWEKLARMDANRATREREGKISFVFVPTEVENRITGQDRFGQNSEIAADMGWEGR